MCLSQWTKIFTLAQILSMLLIFIIKNFDTSSQSAIINRMSHETIIIIFIDLLSLHRMHRK